MLEVSRRQHFVTNKQRGLLWQLRSLQRLHPAASLAFKVPAAGSHLAVPRMGQAVSQSADELISGRKPTPATRQAQPSISNPTHLIVLANGLHGTPANCAVQRNGMETILSSLLPAASLCGYMATGTTILVQLNRHLDSSQVLIHPSDVNRRTDTFDGIDVCGRRLAEEIQGVVKAHPSLQRLSVVGHSMGGLLLRYALGVSFNPDKQTVAGLEPCHFITLATPHLGCDAEGVSQVPFIGWIGALQPLQTLLSAVSIPTAAALFKRTGRQFFMADEDTGQLPGRSLPPPWEEEDIERAVSGVVWRPALWQGDAGLPLLARMTRDVPQRKEYFFSALCSFASRTAYANTGGDHLVGWANSSLRFMHQLPRLPETAASAKGVVLEDKLLAAFDVRFKQQAEPQRATSRSDLPVSVQTEPANLLSHPLTPTSASAAAPLAAAPHSSSPSSCLSTATTLTTSPTRGQPLTSSRGTQPAALFPSTAASQPDAGQQAARSPQVAQASVKQPNQGEAGAPGLGQRGRMVEEMLQQLQSLAWRRIDVSFRGAVMPFAHNHIQARTLISEPGAVGSSVLAAGSRDAGSTLRERAWRYTWRNSWRRWTRRTLLSKRLTGDCRAWRNAAVWRERRHIIFDDQVVFESAQGMQREAVIGSLLLGFLVRGLFTIHVADPLGLHGQPVYTDIPVSQAAIPDLSCRNLFLQLCRALHGDGANTRPSAAVAAVLAAHPDLRARLKAIPRYHYDSNIMDHVGKQPETAFSNLLTLLFAGRLNKSVSLAGAKVLLGTHEDQRRFGFRGLGGGHLPAWSKRQCICVRRMVCGPDVSWLLEEGGVVVTAAMQAEVALQRGLLGLEEGERVDDDWLEDPANRGQLLRHAVHTTREVEAAMAAWQLDMVPWLQSELTNPGLLPRPPRPPTPYAITPTSKCRARHIFIGMMRDAGMLGVLTEEGVTSLKKFRNGALPDPAEPGKYIEGPKDSQVSAPCSEVANRWDASLPDPRRQKLASPKHSFAQIVHTDGVVISVMSLRLKPAAPPAELPRMGRHIGAVNPLAHLDAEWLGVDPGKSYIATVAHEERSAAGTVVSVWQVQATKTWLAQLKPQLNALSHVSSKPSSLASYRRFADTVLEMYDAKWAEISKPRWANAKFRLYCGKKRVVAGFWSKVRPSSTHQAGQEAVPDRILALAYGATGFSSSGTIGYRGVPVSQMLKEALRQFPAGQVVMVDEFRTSRVSSAYSNPNEALPGQPPETFRFHDRDVSAALNIRRCAVGLGPRPTELCRWEGRPAMPKPGNLGREWVYLPDKALLRKWRR
ncbi:hypothetical protein QJQ45_021103 [Haematococcus lacustris]|nr:hypothetical protein QJQ45_021103 [Haematococcus lacustris]